MQFCYNTTRSVDYAVYKGLDFILKTFRSAWTYAPILLMDYNMALIT